MDEIEAEVAATLCPKAAVAYSAQNTKKAVFIEGLQPAMSDLRVRLRLWEQNLILALAVTTKTSGNRYHLGELVDSYKMHASRHKKLP